jgi:PAS domain S-box-containing protein
LCAIVESSDDAIISKDLNSIITSWNAGAERIFGYTAEEAIGQPITMLMPPDRIDEEPGILKQIRRGERIDHYETVRQRKDGTLLDISLTVSPVFDGSGKVVGASKVARDITKRKAAEKAVHLRSAQYETLLNQAPVGAYLVDADFRIRDVNPIAQAFFGETRELDGQDFGKVMHLLWEDEYADEVVRIFRNTLETGDPYFTPERIEMRRDRGEREFYEWQTNRIILPDGRNGVVCYFRDISTQVQAREALKEVDRRKNEFLAILAHELRNPLAPIRNSLQILRMTGDSAPAAQRIHGMMERQVVHMVRLVDDLLELSRINRGTIELKKECVELATVISNSIETSKPMIEAADHQLAVSLPPEPIFVEGDLVRLSQVFSNLLNNAAKYTNRGGNITVSATREAGQLVVSIRDTGIGIPRDMLSRVFDMFMQVDNPLRRSQEGLGIGLSLVRTIVSMHGGNIEARSDGLGRGSEFVVRLPIAEPDCVEKKTTPRGREPAVAPTCRILVVDDNRDAADSLAMLLKLLGADVHLAYDGPSALETLAICRPSIVLLDIGMPGMDGYEVAKRVRKDSRFHDITLIALTGWGQENDRRQSHDVGFDHHLVKPVDFGALQVLLASLDGKKSRDALVTGAS